jgi:hypothetical protein
LPDPTGPTGPTAPTDPTGLTAANPTQRIEVGLQIDIEGHINPGIFLPQWFSHEGLLTDGEVNEASISLDQDEGYVFFRTQDLALEATPERLRLYSLHEGLQLAYRDLALNVFALLRHTPVTTLRIIRFVHLTSAPPVNQPAGPAVHRPLAWERLANLNSWSNLIDDSTLASVSVEGSGPSNSRATVTVEPSHLENASIFTACSYGYSLTPPPDREDSTSTDVLVTTLKDEWEKVVVHSERVFEHVGNVLLAPKDS